MIRKKVRRNPASGDGAQSLEELNRIRKEQYLKKKAMLQDLVNAQKKDIPIQYIILIKQYEDETFDEIYVALDPMLHIFSFLSPHDLLLKVGLVCKSWYFLSFRTNFLWQSLYYKEFGDVQARPIHTALLDEDDDSEFDGHWKKVFSFRVDLRNKWYNNSPDRVGYCDIMESEIVKSTRTKYTNKGELFRKDAHTACVGEDEIGTESENKKLYRVNPEDRSTITTMCLIGSDRLLAGDARGVIKLFNLRSFQQVKKFVGAHQTSVHKIVAITPEHLKFKSDDMSVLGYSFKLEATHHYFLSNDFQNNSICVWDLETGLLLKRFRGTDKVHSVSGSSTHLNGTVLDMRICTINEYGPVLFVITPKNVEIYELNTLRLLKLYRPFYEPKKHEIVTKKLIDAAIESFDKDDIEVEQEEEEADDNFDDDTGMNQPSKTLVCFELLDGNTFAFVSGDMKLYVYNLSNGICVKKMDMKHTKMLDIDNYNRPTSIDSFKKKYNKFKESDVLITQIAKTNLEGQIALVLSLRPSGYNGYDPLKSYIKYFDYRFGCENPVRSCQVGNYDYYSSGKIFFDDDKIIQCTQSHIQLLGRWDGTLKQELLPTLNVGYYTIANFIADDRFLIMGTSFGGIVVNDYGGNLLYWSDLKGRKLVDDEPKEEDKMDDSQD
ncbi:hypothetical protein NAEGRDRAFT_78227 [Naegleria gruberi]|uniref:F-box domain-containing protein n=1 Tax=Naegleria gruberi TaxID=5762 RepID=D2V1C1_NAEGR|nr:uncharacterized protein NAEGRDRAFT_78227 [Naegleria gruberi]EFC49280.1 hypothetical protein NAEGRDRAFT_78227 [Naegleria gruberi]|eukprot:XP_002682024.1 hypothetical protein NAEGRDRAFT_78227 [Naegleria gruberi strain NEG-M]